MGFKATGYADNGYKTFVKFIYCCCIKKSLKIGGEKCFSISFTKTYNVANLNYVNYLNRGSVRGEGNGERDEGRESKR